MTQNNTTSETRYKLSDRMGFRLVFGTVTAVGLVAGGGLFIEKLFEKTEPKTSQNEQVVCEHPDVIFHDGFGKDLPKCITTAPREEKVFSASFESASAPKAENCVPADSISSLGFEKDQPPRKVCDGLTPKL